jgi:hypothetical protein
MTTLLDSTNTTESPVARTCFYACIGRDEPATRNLRRTDPG